MNNLHVDSLVLPVAQHCYAFVAELVGVLHFSIYAGACSVGSKEHKGLVEELENEATVQPALDLGGVAFQACPTVGAKTLWTTERAFGEFFYKVTAFDLYHEKRCPQHRVDRPANWRRLCTVYEEYSKLPEKPIALVDAKLLYGEYQV